MALEVAGLDFTDSNKGLNCCWEKYDLIEVDWLPVLPCEEKTFKNWTSMNQRFLHLTSQTLMNKLKHVHKFMCSFKTEKRKHNRKSDQAKKWKHSIMYDFWLNAKQMPWILVFSNFRYFSTTLQGHTAMHVTKLLQYFSLHGSGCSDCGYATHAGSSTAHGQDTSLFFSWCTWSAAKNTG